MKGFRSRRENKGRVWMACLAAWLFALNGLVLSLAASGGADRAISLADALQLGPVCIHVDDRGAPLAPDHAPSQDCHDHCLLCATHHDRLDGADALAASGGILPPRYGVVVAALIGVLSAAPHPQSGRASSWSPRAPPFAA